MSARNIPPRVIARYEFHVALARETTFGCVQCEGEPKDEDVLRDEAKKPEGRLIRFYNPVASGESSLLIRKNVTCVRQSQAKSDAALRSSGNSKEIYVPPRVLAAGRHDGKRTSVRLRKAFDLQLDELVRETSNTCNI